jgi:microsomal dipeptidase-like Zn-dependent dipeptidase
MPVWGFADLHTHPAAHLGFGAYTDPARPEYGTGGIFWGKPGMALSNAAQSIAGDLPPCPTDKHSGFDEDPVRHGTRQAVIASTNALTGQPPLPHQAGGWPNFVGWPHARSVTHQQMHVSWLKRAFDGGLRLLLASVTDNETLSMLWHRSRGGPRPQHNPEFDYQSAIKQLEFIQRFSEANADWMQIVRSPAEARSVIESNKLAIILSLEMDKLSFAQVQSLYDNHGVRHIIPIHLTNNDFGGVAVYSDLFNTHNAFVNGSYYRVIGDQRVEFKLGRPNYLKYITGDPFGGGDLFKHGAVEPTPLPDRDYQALAYPANQGHRNIQGLSSPLLESLMRLGMLIDVAHMSDASQEGAVQIAEQKNYPLMNSHTGIRPDEGPSHDERAMRRSLLERIGRLGGVLGLGTASNDNGAPIRDWVSAYVDALGVMGGHGVTFGTDFNGFSPQIRPSELPITYPITVASRNAPASHPLQPLGRSQAGNRTFDVNADGLAHIGMLPDFLEAVSRDPRVGENVSKFFRTAEDTIRMWEKAEAVAQGRNIIANEAVAFNITAPPSATSEQFALDHPSLNNDPNWIITTTLQYQGEGYHEVDKLFGVYYVADAGKWVLQYFEAGQILSGRKFNIIAIKP